MDIFETDNDPPTELLSAEAARLDERVRTAQSRVYTVVGLGSSALAFIATQAPAITDRTARIAVYSALPVAWVIVLGMVIMSAGEAVYLSFHLRDVLRRLGVATSSRAFRSEEGLAHGLFSVRSGLRSLRAVYLVMILGAATAYLALVAFSLHGLYVENAHGQFLGVAVFSVLASAVMFSGFCAAMFRTGNLAERALGRIPSAGLPALRFVTWLILPRVDDLLTKGANYWLGAGAAILVMSTAGVPSAVAQFNNWYVPLVAFFCYDFLVSQAKYMLNDLRDRKVDRTTPGKQARRFLARVDLPRGWLRIAAAAATGRYWLGVALSGWLWYRYGLESLLLCSAATLPLQLIYEGVAKQRTLLRCGVASLTYVTRASIGFEAATVAFDGGRLDWRAFSFVAIWMYVLAFSFLLAWWRVQAGFLLRRVHGSPSAEASQANEAVARRRLHWFADPQARAWHGGTVAFLCLVSGAFGWVLRASTAGTSVGLVTGAAVAVGLLGLERTVGRRIENRRAVATLAGVTGLLIVMTAGSSFVLEATTNTALWAVALPGATAAFSGFFYCAPYEMLVFNVDLTKIWRRLGRLFSRLFSLDDSESPSCGV